MAAPLTGMSSRYRTNPVMRKPTGNLGSRSEIDSGDDQWAVAFSFVEWKECFVDLVFGSQIYLPLSVIGSHRDKRRVCRAGPGLAELSCMHRRAQFPICRHWWKMSVIGKEFCLRRVTTAAGRKVRAFAYRSLVGE